MLLLLGDSKTAAATWPTWLLINLNAQGLPGKYMPSLYNHAVSFQTVAQAVTNTIPSINAMNPGIPVKYALCNWGANEMSGALPAEATWKANYLTILDAINAKWPTALVYLMRPWTRGNETKADTLATWISDIQASRSAFVNLGPDERSWLKAADDGAALTSDGVHYTTAGQIECAAQWKTTLRF